MPGHFLRSAPLQQMPHALPQQQRPSRGRLPSNDNLRERKEISRQQSDQELAYIQAISSDLPNAWEADARDTAHKVPSFDTSREVDLHENHPSKRLKLSSSNERDPVQYWVLQNSWPPNYGTMDDNTAASLKRPGTPSYSASCRSGQVPSVHSAAAVPHLAGHGVILDPVEGLQLLSTESKDLCHQMYHGPLHEKFPNISPCIGYPIDKLNSVVAKLECRNEARIVRDLTPLLIPSAENLVLSGMTGLGHIAEDLTANWSNIAAMGGPTPRPDVSVGLGSSAFTQAEVEKLNSYKNWENATTFTSSPLYFPFLICEVKSSDQGIDKAGRKAGHSAAIATRAIWKLYHSLQGQKERQVDASGPLDTPSGVFVEGQADMQGDEAQSEEVDRSQPAEAANVLVKELNGKVLVFSIAHTHKIVELYGHFPVSNDGDARLTIYRHSIASETLLGNAEERCGKIRNFVLKVYFTFSQTHLQRIRRALAAMPDVQSAPLRVHRVGPDAEAMPPPSQSATQTLTQQLTQQLDEMKAEREKDRAQISQLLEILKQMTSKNAA